MARLLPFRKKNSERALLIGFGVEEIRDESVLYRVWVRDSCCSREWSTRWRCRRTSSLMAGDRTGCVKLDWMNVDAVDLLRLFAIVLD